MPPAAPASPDKAPTETPGAETFIVAVGASAGGLEALSSLLKHVPVQTGFAIIIAQHLDPHHESLLVELLSRTSELPVSWAENGRGILAGHVYVVPAASLLTLHEGTMVLHPDDKKSGGRIDRLFQSLADTARERAVGVLLSGNGDDGILGLRAIKGAGGLTFAQDPSSASFPGLPNAAIDAGCIDRIATPAQIAVELVQLMRTSHLLLDRIGRDDRPEHSPEAMHLAQVFRLLASRTGVDFNEYKQTTIKRRLLRRMALTKAPDVPSYVKMLQKNREEIDALYENLLINVTDFFRDPDCFEFLQQEILPQLASRHSDGTAVRVWVPGCSTGEEAYSLAIGLREVLEARGQAVHVQIFGTDISERALNVARAGAYTNVDVNGVTPERLRRFFHKTERGYQIRKEVRDMCIFARQNVAKDSPFSRLDLISCRNLLIYLNAAVQRKLMPIFHYALNPSGFLLLGTSESVGGHAELYRLIDRRFRIYERKPGRHRAPVQFALDRAQPAPATPRPLPVMPDHHAEPFDIIREADRIVLSRLGPSGVLINEDLEILQFRGDVSPYLAPLEGRASLNLVKMARDGLAAELEAAVLEAKQKNIRVHRTGLSVLHGNVAKPIGVDITPIDTVHPRERFYLVLFHSADPGGAAPEESESKIKAKKSVYLAQIEQLRQDLQATRSYLQSTIEKHEATNQELRAANEEIQSSNEELQSTNEELETAKEELQSTNEELTTVNEELHSRQLELMQLNNDLNNLINSVHLPIIILGQDLRIRRFTPMAEKVLKVIPTDIGRPLTDINISLNIADLPRLTAEVIDSLTVKELEIQDVRGRWYSMRLRPYKTADNKIDGVVITLIDIDEMKRTIAQAEESRDFAHAVVEAAPDAMAAIDASGRIRAANEGFFRLFQLAHESELFPALREGGLLEGLRAPLEDIFAKNGSTAFEQDIDLELPGGPARLTISARQIARGTRAYPIVLLTFRRRA